MSTVTSTAVSKQNVFGSHVGMQAKVVKAVVAVTAGSSVLMCKVPHGFRVVDGWVTTPADSFKVSVGPNGDLDRYIVSATNTAAQLHRFSAAGGMGDRISLSDDATNRYTTIDVLVGSASCTGTIALMVCGFMDLGNEG